MPDFPRTDSAPQGASSLDKGAWALVWLFLGALVMGAVVIAVQPAYRATLLSLLRGNGDDTPIARTNARYYGAVSTPAPSASEAPSVDEMP